MNNNIQQLSPKGDFFKELEEHQIFSHEGRRVCYSKEKIPVVVTFTFSMVVIDLNLVKSIVTGLGVEISEQKNLFNFILDLMKSEIEPFLVTKSIINISDVDEFQSEAIRHLKILLKAYGLELTDLQVKILTTDKSLSNSNVKDIPKWILYPIAVLVFVSVVYILSIT